MKKKKIELLQADRCNVRHVIRAAFVCEHWGVTSNSMMKKARP